MNCNHPMPLADCKITCRNCGLDYGWELDMSRVDIEFKNNLIEIKEKDDTKTNGTISWYGGF